MLEAKCDVGKACGDMFETQGEMDVAGGEVLETKAKFMRMRAEKGREKRQRLKESTTEMHEAIDEAESSENVVKTDSKEVKMTDLKPYKIDWRRCNYSVRDEVYSQLIGVDDDIVLEKMAKNAVIEHSSICALCKEIGIRFDLGSEFLIVPPSITTSYSSFEKAEDDYGGEVAKYRDVVKNTKHVFFIVWADKPRHYTYIYTRKPEPGSHL